MTASRWRGVPARQGERQEERQGWGARAAAAFDRAFARFQDAYGRALETVLGRRRFVLACVALLLVATGALMPIAGTDFFPGADVGIIKLHVRAPRGNRHAGVLPGGRWSGVERVEEGGRRA